jgi:hypothetical protein
MPDGHVKRHSRIYGSEERVSRHGDSSMGCFQSCPSAALLHDLALIEFLLFFSVNCVCLQQLLGFSGMLDKLAWECISTELRYCIERPEKTLS